MADSWHRRFICTGVDLNQSLLNCKKLTYNEKRLFRPKSGKKQQQKKKKRARGSSSTAEEDVSDKMILEKLSKVHEGIKTLKEELKSEIQAA